MTQHPMPSTSTRLAGLACEPRPTARKREQARRLNGQPRRTAFTLIELLVVIGIIVIIAAVSVPAFRFITGSRSVDSGQNVVNAMMGRARTQAIVSGDRCGVFFFVDPRNDRSTLALVRQGSSDGEYSGWAFATTGETSLQSVNYYDQPSNPDGDPSSSLQLVQTNPSPGAQYTSEQFIAPGQQSFQRLTAVFFQCIQSYAASAAVPNEVTPVPAYSNNYWNSNATSLEIVRDTEFQLLPQGVGAEVVIDPLNPLIWNNNPNLGVDRYVRTGCVMFDSQGRFASLPYDVFISSHLGQALMLNQIPSSSSGSTQVSLAAGAGTSPPLPLFSGFGIVLFDRQALLADAKTNQYTEGDYLYTRDPTNLHLPAPPFGPPLATNTPSIEQAKETWLDTNGLLLTATRYNGAMTKGE